jgi:hypothetical protein
MSKWIVFQREVKSNGKPFPYQHDEITRWYLTAINTFSREIAEAQGFTDYQQARKIARAYRAEAGKVSQ